MKRLFMNGPFRLTAENIDAYVLPSYPGNFALGMKKEDGGFIVKWIGRAEECVNFRLKEWIDRYPDFKFSYSTTPKEAFEKECRIYHEFGINGKLDNPAHPTPPESSQWECPECG